MPIDASRSAPPKSQSNVDLLKKAVDMNRCVQFSKPFNFNFKLFSLNEINWGDAEPGPNLPQSLVTKITKDCGKLKALPKSGYDISLDQISFSLKEQLSKYHKLIDNDQALCSIHNLLQSQFAILNKALECQLKEILKAHSNHCNLLASVVLHNYSSELSFPTISPNQKKFLNTLFQGTENMKVNNQN